jgi:hypothetical protein
MLRQAQEARREQVSGRGVRPRQVEELKTRRALQQLSKGRVRRR